MQTFVTPLFGKAKVKLTQIPRAVTPFGGLASFVGKSATPGKCGGILPWQLTSPNAVPLAHTLTAFCLGVVAGARRFAHTEMARADGALHALLGWERWLGADTVRGFFHRFGPATIQAFLAAVVGMIAGTGAWFGGRFFAGLGFDRVPAQRIPGGRSRRV